MKRLLPLSLTLALTLLLMVTAAGSTSRTAVRVVLNGEALDTAAYMEDGRTMVPLRDVAEAMGLTVAWNQATYTAYLSDGTWQPGLEQFTVVLDPGHGGVRDGVSYDGARYGGVRECDLNLSIARKAADKLAALGLNVVMTRTDDSYIDLYERTDLARAAGADLFVSVHCNASDTDPAATGIYTAYHPEGRGGHQLADVLRQSMMAATGAGDQGVWPRPNLAVLRTAAMPAALVECGFMSTPEELALLAREDYQEKLAQGIADGVVQFLTV